MLQFAFFACIIKIIVYFIIHPCRTDISRVALPMHTPIHPYLAPPSVAPPPHPPYVSLPTLHLEIPLSYMGGATGREIFIRKNGFFHRGYPFFLKIEIAKNFFRKILKISKTDLVFFMVYIVFISKNDVII